MVFKKGVKLRANGRWKMNGQNTEVANKFSYLKVTEIERVEFKDADVGEYIQNGV